MSFDTSTGEISGTPTAITSSASYTITASNTGGSDTVSITIEVNDVAPSSLSYSPNSFTLTKGTAMTSVTPTVSGGTVTSWSASPSLPAGLSLDSSTGAISGTPTAVVSSTTYTITASNTGGSDTATLTFVVNDVTPSSLNYNPNSFTLTKGTAMTSVTPTVSGGTVTLGHHPHLSLLVYLLIHQPEQSQELQVQSCLQQPTQSLQVTQVEVPQPQLQLLSMTLHRLRLVTIQVQSPN